MKWFIPIFVVLFLSCASTPRTPYNDPVLRVLVAGEIDHEVYVNVVHAVASTGKFRVVDRQDGLKAAIDEQDRQHESGRDRFDNQEKWAIWGKLYGARGVVVASQDCGRYIGGWRGEFTRCRQTLQVVDLNTSEILVSVDHVQDGDAIGISWDEIAWKLADRFPKNFEKPKDSDELKAYRKLAGEEAAKRPVKPREEE